MSWQEARDAASRLWGRAVAAGRPGEHTREPGFPDRELSLVLYATAGERNRDADAVEAAWLRYRLDDPDALLTWLCAQLQRMGHTVRAPLRLEDPATRTVDDSRAVSMSSLLHADVDEDPVAWAWTRTTLFTAEEVEVAETRIMMSPRCPLLDVRPSLCQRLDDLLVIERGGWGRGARVAARGVPPYSGPLGTTAAEDGVHPYRAVVLAPRWSADHTAHTIVPGPPRAYRVAYRGARDGIPVIDAAAVVGAEHLHQDLGPWHQAPEATAGAAEASMATAPEESGPEIAHPPSVLASPIGAKHRGGPGGTLEAHAAAWAEAETEKVRAEQAAVFLRTHDALRDPLPEDPHQRYRATALVRLWELRDRELARAGDSTPERIAERITSELGYPKPLRPPTSRQLATDEQIRKRTPAPRWSPDAVPDQQLVTGLRREQLVQWLPHVTDAWTTPRQHEALDGVTGRPTLTQLRALLAVEGFVQIADLHRTGGIPITPADLAPGLLARPLPAPDGLRSGPVDLVLAHPSDRLLAVLHADQISGAELTLVSCTVYFRVIPLDRDLVGTVFRTVQYERDPAGQLTGVQHGRFATHPLGKGSLRVRLAVLRAFTQPAPEPLPPVHLGADRDAVHRQPELYRLLLEQAPTWARPLIDTTRATND